MTQGESSVASPVAPRTPVVGIGASAGGLEALTALLARLTASRIAFVVLQHLSPTHESKLPEILSRATPLPVVTAKDGAVVEAGTIHVAPPAMDVTLQAGALHLTAATTDLPHHPIDRLFRSIASDLGELAIGVVLSGVGSDGTIGLRAIRAEAGIAFVQEPSTAAQAGMPQSAIDAGCADFCMSPAEIGDELMRLAAHPYVARQPRGLAEPARALLLAQLRQAFGVDFTAYKQSTIERRIERRMALSKVERIDDYLALLREHPDELGTLYSDLLIGVTGFFRDGEPFELLKTVVFPRVLEHRAPDAPIRIWVPGCSTGEEAYSIAMVLVDDQLRVIWVNRAFFDAFRVGAEILGRPLDELWEGARANTALWTALVEAAAGRQTFDALRVEHPFVREGGAAMTFSARCIAAELDRPALALVTMKDESRQETPP